MIGLLEHSLSSLTSFVVPSTPSQPGEQSLESLPLPFPLASNLRSQESGVRSQEFVSPLVVRENILKVPLLALLLLVSPKVFPLGWLLTHFYIERFPFY